MKRREISATWGSALWLAALLISAAGSGIAEEREIELDEIVVTGEVLLPQAEVVPPATLESGRFVNIGETLSEVPGVGLVRRATSAPEPVIRGLGYERVSTQINGLPIYGACPARMDPPVIYGRAHSAEKVLVIKGVPSVTLGPAGTGGRVIIKTDYERDPDAEPGAERWARLGYDGARDGISGEVGVKGGNAAIDFKAVAEGSDYGDYASASGVEVPADQENYSAGLNFAWRPRPNHRWWNYFGYVRDQDVEYPSLPMNLKETDFITAHTGYRIDLDSGILNRFDANFGMFDIDHVMSNEGKPGRSMSQNQTDTDAEAYSAFVNLTWRLSDDMELATGADLFHLKRDGLRERYNVAMNQRFFDHIWPDSTQWDVGGFAELRMFLGDDWLLRVGGRVDQVESEAGAIDEMSLQRKTIRESFVRFYGPEAADADASETVGAGNILLEWMAPGITDALSLHVGAGVSSRTAGVTERYFAFAPAPGGFQIGNPTLDPEIKYEVEAGLDWQSDWAECALSAYHFWVNDYINPVALAREEINGDGNPDLIRGYENIDARLYGAEAALTLKLGERWWIPMTLSYVRGENTTDDRDLPEIPPLEGRAALRYVDTTANPWWVQFGGRFVARQDKVDEEFPEDETAGFSVFHLRAGAVANRKFHVEAGIENLFDQDYHEHLTRESLLPVGDLMAGDEIPAPGQSVYVSFRVKF